jgi:hypothetical protein
LSLTGTAEEIDQELAQTLKNFAESHVQLQETFDRAKEQIAEAVKAIEERDKNKSKSKTVIQPKQDQDTDTSKGVTTTPGLFDVAAAASSQDNKPDGDAHRPSAAE